MTNAISPPSSTLRSYGILLLFYILSTTPYQACVFFSGQTSIGQFLTAIGFSAIWLIPIYLLPSITKTYCAVTGAIFTLLTIVKLGYFALYHTPVTQSALFVAFDSNNREGSEFILSYLHWWMPLLAMAYIILITALWYKIKRPTACRSERKYLLCSLLILFSFATPILSRAISSHGDSDAIFSRIHKNFGFSTPFTIATSYTSYQNQLKNMNALIEHASTIPPVPGLVDNENDKEKTIVVVIGESTDRHRMGLYGYSRDTSPELNKIKDQLDIFNNIYTARPYTIETLEQVLSFGDERHPNLYMSQPTLLAMMKQAGYKTFWITNQQTLTKRNTMLTFFSQQADEQVYLNNNDKQNISSYDQKVLSPFEKVLKDKAKKKFIVVHLLGTHRDYKYRYTAKFDTFHSQKNLPTKLALTGDESIKYNEYDNAVRYNDWLVSKLIKTYKASSPYGLMMYFSDHGEEVYNYRDYNGRDESNPSEYMYSIPFITWRSPSWKQAHPDNWKPYLNRLYSSQHFISTLSQMIGLSYDGQRLDQSVISHSFKEDEVLVGDPNKQSQLRNLRTNPLPG